MVSFRSLLATAASLALAVAQAPNIAFSSVPAVAVAGQTYNITWGGGDGTAVTLTLRKGNPDNLDTIGTLASRVTTGYYLWTVPTSLESARDYALQITQGQSGINYSGLFTVVGGSGSSSISYSGLTSSTANATIITTGVTSARSTDASMGTGTTMPRNTTFSSQSLSSTPHTITTAASTTTRAATTVSQSASVSQQTSAPSTNVGASMGSSAALVMGLFGAIMFLQ